MKLFPFILILIMTQLGYAQDSQKVITSGPRNGHLIIVGGSLTDTSIYARFMELAGGPDAPIVIIPTAGNDEFLIEQNGIEKTKERFQQHGFNDIKVLHTRNREEANSEEFFAPIQTSWRCLVQLVEGSGGWLIRTWTQKPMRNYSIYLTGEVLLVAVQQEPLFRDPTWYGVIQKQM